MLWKEEIDLLYKKYAHTLEAVFKGHAGKKVLPGQKPFMCLDEFLDIFKKCEVLGDHMNEKDIYMAFNFSMRTQVDEIKSERIFQMCYLEFLEALGRVIDHAHFDITALVFYLNINELHLLQLNLF